MTKKRTHGEYEQLLFDKEIDAVPLESYIDSHSKILHECINGHQWKISPANLLNGRNCPVCAGNKTITTEEYKNSVQYEVLEEYQGNRAPILHKCACGCEWKASPSNIKKGHGCPACAGKFNSLTEAMFYYAKLLIDGKSYYKVGITTRNPKLRFIGENYQILLEKKFSNGLEAVKFEKEILKNFENKRIFNGNIGLLKRGGDTELFEEDILQLDSCPRNRPALRTSEP